MGYVYFVRQAEDDIFKIGMTNKVPKSRLEQLQVNSPFELSIFGLIGTVDARKVEKQLHRKFRDQRLHGEWFSLSEQEAEQALKEFGGEKLDCDFIELRQENKYFFYQISTGKLFVALQTIRKCFSHFYATSFLVAWSNLVSIDGQIAVDYDVLIEDFESPRELTEHKEFLINHAKAELAP